MASHCCTKSVGMPVSSRPSSNAVCRGKAKSGSAIACGCLALLLNNRGRQLVTEADRQGLPLISRHRYLPKVAILPHLLRRQHERLQPPHFGGATQRPQIHRIFDQAGAKRQSLAGRGWLGRSRRHQTTIISGQPAASDQRRKVLEINVPVPRSILFHLLTTSPTHLPIPTGLLFFR